MLIHDIRGVFAVLAFVGIISHYWDKPPQAIQFAPEPAAELCTAATSSPHRS